MRILMVGTYPVEPGVVNGGIESVTSTLVPALAARDDVESVTVLSLHNGTARSEYRREGPKVEVHHMRGQRRLRRLTGSFLDVRRARRLAAAIGPDVVHGQEIGFNGDIATRCSDSAVVTVHGLVHREMRMGAGACWRDRLRVWTTDRLVARVLRRAKIVISISDYDRSELAFMIHGRQVAIANPTGAEYFALAPSRVTTQRLLFAGVLTARKDVLGLVNAFAQAHRGRPAARLVIVGPQPDPQYARAVRDRVEALGLTGYVNIVGLVDNERLRAEIAAARAVVLFSREETAPTIIAQATAAGKPVIASRVGGVAGMVADGVTGFVVPAGDELGLADRMGELLDDQPRCLDMGAAAHESAVERFSPDAVAERTVTAYRSAAGLPSPDTVHTRRP
jgi:glycosyltransferase involved in cell wall biosynthesis